MRPVVHLVHLSQRRNLREKGRASIPEAPAPGRIALVCSSPPPPQRLVAFSVVLKGCAEHTQKWTSARCHVTSSTRVSLPRDAPNLSRRFCCAKSLWGEAPCGSAVYMARWMKCPLPPSPLNPPDPLLPQTPLCGRQGGQGRIDDITGKGLRTAVALSTASCFLCGDT